MNVNPITKTDIKAAQQGIYECRQVDALLEKMRALGLPCDEQCARSEHLKGFFECLIREFQNPILVSG